MNTTKPVMVLLIIGLIFALPAFVVAIVRSDWITSVIAGGVAAMLLVLIILLRRQRRAP